MIGGTICKPLFKQTLYCRILHCRQYCCFQCYGTGRSQPFCIAAGAQIFFQRRQHTEHRLRLHLQKHFERSIPQTNFFLNLLFSFQIFDKSRLFWGIKQICKTPILKDTFTLGAGADINRTGSATLLLLLRWCESTVPLLTTGAGGKEAGRWFPRDLGPNNRDMRWLFSSLKIWICI